MPPPAKRPFKRQETNPLNRTSFQLPVPSEAVPESEAPSHGATAGVRINDSFLEELEIEVMEKVNQMKSLADRLSLRLQSNFRCEVLKLPSAIRSMTMQEFCVQCGGDVDEALKQHAALKRSRAAASVNLMPPPATPMAPKAALTRAKPAPSTVGRATRGRRGSAMETPGATPGAGGARSTRSRVSHATPGGLVAATPGGMVPFTPRVGETPRIAKKGEMAFTANGSPINMIHTVKARGTTRRPGRFSTQPQSNILITLQDGTELDLAEASTCVFCRPPQPRCSQPRNRCPKHSDRPLRGSGRPLPAQTDETVPEERRCTCCSCVRAPLLPFHTGGAISSKMMRAAPMQSASC